MKFTIPGAPVSKGRPRVVRGHTYTPEKTARYEHKVRLCALTAGVKCTSAPIHLGLAFYLPDKRRRDGDNLQKAVMDGLISVAYLDDSQVKSWVGGIFYDPANPRCEVTIEAMP